MAAYEWITFTSDYGLDDSFVGVCRGVIARIAPSVRVLDVSHFVRAQDVRQGATVLAQSAPFMPRAVHLAIVDPGVGTKRRGVAIEAGDAALVGPDNGLLLWAADALGGVRRAVELVNADYQLQNVSKTFHGRDIFAPAAAHLAAGVDAGELGPMVDPESLERLAAARLTVDDDHVHGEVAMVDHFGNIQLSVSRGDLESVGVVLGDTVELRLSGQGHRAPFAETFAAVPVGRLVICEDSYHQLAIAVNQGRAADRLKARTGDPVVVGRLSG